MQQIDGGVGFFDLANKTYQLTKLYVETNAQRFESRYTYGQPGRRY